MAIGAGHEAVVAEWAERCGSGLAAEPLLAAFLAAFDAVWARARQTLGDPTLTAILDRVLLTAREAHPVLASVTGDARGLSPGALREQARDLEPAELLLGARYVLEELLRVIGALTADILTPGLHAALRDLPPVRDAEGET